MTGAWSVLNKPCLTAPEFLLLSRLVPPTPPHPRSGPFAEVQREPEGTGSRESQSTHQQISLGQACSRMPPYLEPLLGLKLQIPPRIESHLIRASHVALCWPTRCPQRPCSLPTAGWLLPAGRAAPPRPRASVRVCVRSAVLDCRDCAWKPHLAKELLASLSEAASPLPVQLLLNSLPRCSPPLV